MYVYYICVILTLIGLESSGPPPNLSLIFFFNN